MYECQNTFIPDRHDELSYLCSFHDLLPDVWQFGFRYLLLGQYSHFQIQDPSLADPEREQRHLFQSLCPMGDLTKRRSLAKMALSSDRARF
jgi:hypothetical protein